MSRALGPAVRNLLERYGLSASKITSSGPRGLLLKGDVLQHIQKENVKPVPSKKIPSQCLAKITTEFIYIYIYFFSCCCFKTNNLTYYFCRETVGCSEGRYDQKGSESITRTRISRLGTFKHETHNR